MSRNQRILAYGSAGLLFVVGVTCGVVIGGEAGGLLATVLGGLGLVGITGLVFMEVGLSEDRERAREERAREREERQRTPRPTRRQRRLERQRGERRRLR